MKKELLISYREIKTIIVIALILSFIFGFNDNKPNFVLKDWLKNLIYIFILSFSIVLANNLGYKLMARYANSNVEIKIWNSHVFKEEFKFSKIPLYIFTPVLPALIALFSNGQWFVPVVNTFNVNDYSVYGRKFPKLTYFNQGLIAVTGLFFVFILMIFFKILLINEGIKIGSWFILFNLIPISDLPGAKIFIASRVMYLSSLLFFILNILLIQNLNVLSSIIISLFFSVLIGVIYFYYIEYKK
jgi:hypothetical protein